MPVLAAVVGLLGLLVFLVFVAGASWNAATMGLVLAGGALLFALRSFFQMARVLARPGTHLEAGSGVLWTPEGPRELREERHRLLRAINELKFDYEMGKLSEADYREVRQGYELKAIEVMRALESEAPLDPAVVAELAARGIAWESAAEASPAAAQAPPAPQEEPLDVVQQRPQDPPAPQEEPLDVVQQRPQGPPAPQEEPLDVVQQRSQEPPATLSVCEGCRGLNDADAKFCKHCGAKLK